jgi:hypothetical protein
MRVPGVLPQVAVQILKVSGVAVPVMTYILGFMICWFPGMVSNYMPDIDLSI